MRERGLKSTLSIDFLKELPGRSREGAWIEIAVVLNFVLPKGSRSREGAWIEITVHRK